MHDPFQTYPAVGPFGLPTGSLYAAQQNPAAALSQLAATLGMPSAVPPAGISQIGQQPGYPVLQGQGSISPQPWQQLTPGLGAPSAIPQAFGVSPFAGIQNLQHPLLAALLGNPFVTAGMQTQPFNGLLSPIGSAVSPQLGWQQPYSQFPQIGQLSSPFGQVGQFGSPFGQIGYPLAPQSWVGQGLAGGQPFAQIHPALAHLAARQYQTPGSPFGY